MLSYTFLIGAQCFWAIVKKEIYLVISAVPVIGSTMTSYLNMVGDIWMGGKGPGMK